MKLTQLTEQKERPYICVHTKKGKHETNAVSSYDAAKNAAEHWGMKSTAGITAKLADVEHVAEEVITEGPCDIATKDDISKMSGEEYDKYAQWKKDCEAEERTTPLSTKRLESESDFDDYEGDMSQEEYDQTVDDSEMEYTVWVGGTEVNDHWLNYEDAVSLYDKYKAQGYDDIQLDARMKVKEGSFWGRDDMVAKMKKDELAAGMRKYRKQDGGSYSGTTTSDPEHWERLEADGYEWDKDYYKDIEEGEKPDFLDLDKDGDKKEPMKKAAKDKKAVKEGDEEELYFNYDDIGGNIIVNPKSTIEDQIGDLLDEYYGIGPDEFDPSKIEITSSHPSDEDLARNEERTDEFLPALAIGGIAGALMSDRKAKRDAEQLNAEEGDDEAEAVAARDEFLKVMDMKGKTPGPGKQIDTIKKIVADKQNMKVAFDDGKMRVDLYTASAVSQVYDAVKPETQVKIDNMLRTKAGMLKMSDFAFSKLKEGLKEGKQLDEILPLVGLALGAVGRAVAGGVARAAGSVAKAAVAKPVSTALKTRAVANTMKDKDKTVTQKAAGVAKITGMAEENLDEISPYTGADGIKDKNGKMHGPNSPRGKMIKNMTKKVVAPKTTAGVKPSVKPAQSTVKPAGVGRGNGAGSKATQIKPGAGVKPPAGKSALQKGGNLVGKAAKGAVGLIKKIGNPIAKGAANSGFGNPLSASKQYADDMVEKAMKDAEEIEEISIRPAPKIKVSGPHGQKPGSHHPPAKSAPRFKASVKF